MLVEHFAIPFQQVCEMRLLISAITVHFLINDSGKISNYLVYLIHMDCLLKSFSQENPFKIVI